MLSFRQKIFINYVVVFLVFIIVMFPIISHWVQYLVIQTMETQVVEIIAKIQDAPNDEALIRRLKNQKSSAFFRFGLINDEQKILYDSHVKRILGPKFSQDYVVYHPEVLEAFEKGEGYHEEFSKLLDQKFSYFAKAFDFNSHKYVLRASFPHHYISQLVKDFEIGFLGFASAILLLFSLMTWFIINYLTKPIQEIINGVKPYQDGLQTTLPAIDMSHINPHGDFAQLALTLNGLSAKIQKHIDILVDERNEKKSILESLVEGVIAVDENFKISYVNSTAKYFIEANEHLIGENFKSTNQNKCIELLQNCQKEQKILSDTLQTTIDGKRVYLEILAAPKKENGGAILVLQDTTAHHKIAEMRRDFIANASHELKTPITIIRGFTEALQDNPELPLDMQKEITDKIMKNCERMTHLIKDLLTLADIENIPHSRLVYCDIVKLINGCHHILLEIFPEAKLSINKSDDQEFNIIADANLLELAFMNLIENAAKYSSSPASITISLQEFTDRISISVEDKGLGIPEADLEYIFDRFYSVDKAHSKKLGGSGLGLSIVKTIIEKHMGTITVSSVLGEGTTFTMILPKREIDLEST